MFIVTMFIVTMFTRRESVLELGDNCGGPREDLFYMRLAKVLGFNFVMDL
jgi:hypothetical protein